MAVTPPRRTARGREHDRLITHLTLTGNTNFSTAEYMQLASQLTARFYHTPGSLTSALRTAAQVLNQALLERNLATTGRGQYAIGWLVLGALRNNQFYFLICGPAHVLWAGQSEKRHLYDPAISGKGLGLSQTTNLYFSQFDLQPGDRLLMCGQMPTGWDSALLSDPGPVSMDVVRRRLVTLTEEDLNAVLVLVQAGSGKINISKPSRTGIEVSSEKTTQAQPEPVPVSQTETIPGTSPFEVSFAEPEAPPSAYAVPAQKNYQPPVPPPEEPITTPDFPASIPRASLDEPVGTTAKDEYPTITEIQVNAIPKQPSEQTRQIARTLARAIQTTRLTRQNISERLRNFLPNLLPGTQANELEETPTWIMLSTAAAIAIVIGVIGVLMYMKFGVGSLYQTYMKQALEARARAVSQETITEQKNAWKEVLSLVDKAEGEYHVTGDSQSLREEAQSDLDSLQGIIRLDFSPIFSSGLGRSVNIDQMVVNDGNLYMLDSINGEVLLAGITVQNYYQLDTNFNCEPGPYEGYQVSTIIDIQPLPKGNKTGAELLGIDRNGNLLYCGPNRTPSAIPLPPPDISWNEVTAFAIEGNSLYVLDASARAVWVYIGQDGEFIERPLFFFGQQVPTVETVVDLAVNGDDLYLLHSDGHLSTCSYSRLESVPTRCADPAPLIDPFLGNETNNQLVNPNFAQIFFSAPPDSSVLLLDSINKSVYRFSPRALELQHQLQAQYGKENPLKEAITAMTMGSNRMLFLATGDHVYLATDIP